MEFNSMGYKLKILADHDDFKNGNIIKEKRFLYDKVFECQKCKGDFFEKCPGLGKFCKGDWEEDAYIEMMTKRDENDDEFDLEECCGECGEYAEEMCMECGLPLCHMHNEVLGGFCTDCVTK